MPSPSPSSSPPASFHLTRTPTVKQTDALTQYRGIRTTTWPSPAPGKSVLEIQTTHTPMVLQSVPEKVNYLTPPLHWHWYQDEFFHVTRGRYIFTLEGKNITYSASDPQPLRIPATARHTFKVDDTHEGPCTVEISTYISPRSPTDEPEAQGANEKFFRNIYSYLDDCYTQDVSPSLPQLLLFMDSAEVSLAFPGPAWLAQPMSYAFGVVVGRWVGQYVLGYRASYPEYWDESKDGRKSK